MTESPLDAMADGLGRWAYSRLLRLVRLARWPVLAFGVGLCGYGLWKLDHGLSIGWVPVFAGMTTVVLNLATWKLVRTHTEPPV